MAGGPTTTFDFTWNSAWLATPADTEDRSLGAQRIRDSKQAVGERLAVNHSLNGDTNDGMHFLVQMLLQGGDPTAWSGGGTIYTKTTNSIVELFYQDSSGNVTQITSDGELDGSDLLPSGTNLLFLQAAVPTGWTINTTYGDQMIRIATGVSTDTGGATGGSWTFSGASIGTTTLTTSQLPNMSVPVAIYNITGSGTAAGFGSGGDNAIYYQLTQEATTLNGGQGHSHTFSNDASWRPAYANAIVGTKD